MKENLEVSQVHTTCLNCVFAQFEGKTQVGCRLNKTEDYKKAGVEIMRVYDDSENEFDLINGRFCMFYRNEEVMKSYPRDTWESIVHLQTKVPYHAIVFINKESTFKEIKDTLRSLKDQDIAPNLVTLINKQYLDYDKNPEKYIKPSAILEMVDDFKFHKFSLKNIYDDQLDDRSLVDLVFDGTKDNPYPFYTTFKSGFHVPKNFSKELNDSILIGMKQIGFASPVDDLNGMIVSRVAHKKHGGNAFNVSLEEKIKKFEDNSEKFIYEAKDICPSLM